MGSIRVFDCIAGQNGVAGFCNSVLHFNGLFGQRTFTIEGTQGRRIFLRKKEQPIPSQVMFLSTAKLILLSPLVIVALAFKIYSQKKWDYAVLTTASPSIHKVADVRASKLPIEIHPQPLCPEKVASQLQLNPQKNTQPTSQQEADQNTFLQNRENSQDHFLPAPILTAAKPLPAPMPILTAPIPAAAPLSALKPIFSVPIVTAAKASFLRTPCVMASIPSFAEIEKRLSQQAVQNTDDQSLSTLPKIQVQEALAVPVNPKTEELPPHPMYNDLNQLVEALEAAAPTHDSFKTLKNQLTIISQKQDVESPEFVNCQNDVVKVLNDLKPDFLRAHPEVATQYRAFLAKYPQSKLFQPLILRSSDKNAVTLDYLSTCLESSWVERCCNNPMREQNRSITSPLFTPEVLDQIAAAVRQTPLNPMNLKAILLLYETMHVFDFDNLLEAYRASFEKYLNDPICSVADLSVIWNCAELRKDTILMAACMNYVVKNKLLETSSDLLPPLLKQACETLQPFIKEVRRSWNTGYVHLTTADPGLIHFCKSLGIEFLRIPVYDELSDQTVRSLKGFKKLTIAFGHQPLEGADIVAGWIKCAQKWGNLDNAPAVPDETLATLDPSLFAHQPKKSSFGEEIWKIGKFDDLSALSQIEKAMTPKLESLHLRFPELQEAGTKKLASILKSAPHVTTLSLFDTDIRGVSTELCEMIAENQTLETLCLQSSSIDNLTLGCLEKAFQKNKKLKRVYFTGKFADYAKESFEKAIANHPAKLQVVW